MTYPSDNPLWTKGVDVSAVGQPNLLSWAHIAANGERVAYVKSSEGLGPHGDSMADHHASGAADNGLLVDYYHFLHSDLSGKAQAIFAVDTIAKLKTERKLRFMLDCEDQERILRVGAAKSLDCWIECIDFLDDMLEERILLYTGKGVMDIFRRAKLDVSLLHLVEMCDLEVAHYRIDPGSGYDYNIQEPNIPLPFTKANTICWQWAGNKGPRIPGITVDLDRDVWFMSEAELRAWGSADNRREPAPSFMDTPAQVLGRADRAEADTDPDSPEALAKAEEAKGRAS